MGGTRGSARCLDRESSVRVSATWVCAGVARDKTYAATLTASEDSGEWPRRLHGSIYEARGVGRKGWSRDPSLSADSSCPDLRYPWQCLPCFRLLWRWPPLLLRRAPASCSAPSCPRRALHAPPQGCSGALPCRFSTTENPKIIIKRFLGAPSTTPWASSARETPSFTIKSLALLYQWDAPLAR